VAIFRNIAVRTYGDEKFLRLSRPQPCGQYLWLYLLTGPHTTSIPGLSHVGEMAMAEALGWPLEGFREAFKEAFREGLVKADWKARVLWIPNAIKHNPPGSPNVVKSWWHHWDCIPECPLKVEAGHALATFLEFMGPSWKAFGKPFGKALAKALANQEQEQEQEQDTHTEARAEGKPFGKPSGKPSENGSLLGFEKFWSAYPAKRAQTVAAEAWKAIDPDAALVQTILAAVERQKRSKQWSERGAIPNPAKWLAERRWEDSEDQVGDSSDERRRKAAELAERSRRERETAGSAEDWDRARRARKDTEQE